MTSSADIKNLGGRPRTGIGTPVMVRLQPDILAKVDAWAEKHGAKRPEAIRAMIEAAVKAGGLDD